MDVVIHYSCSQDSELGAVCHVSQCLLFDKFTLVNATHLLWFLELAV